MTDNPLAVIRRQLRKARSSIQAKQTEAEKVHNQGAWSPEEKALYKEFVSDNPEMFVRGKTRSFQSFKEMSYLIKTRTPLQCRIHHRRVLSSARMKEARRDIQQYIPRNCNASKVQAVSSSALASEHAAKVEQPKVETTPFAKPQQSVQNPIDISTRPYSNPQDYEALRRCYELQQQAWMIWMASQGYRY